MMQNLNGNWFDSLKLTWGIWQISTQALKNLKNLYVNGLLLTKVYNIRVKKKYRGVIFDGTQDWYKVWKKTDLCFQKWHEEIGKFSPEHLKVSKLGTWWHSFA